MSCLQKAEERLEILSVPEKRCSRAGDRVAEGCEAKLLFGNGFHGHWARKGKTEKMIKEILVVHTKESVSEERETASVIFLHDLV